MGNVSGRGDGEGRTSGEYLAEEGSDSRSMEFAQSERSRSRELLVQSSPLGTWEFRSNIFHPQRADAQSMHSEKRMPVMVTWSHGGERVAVSGSWNNWEMIEPMERSGKDFIIMKVLPSGIYHFRFIVDGHLTYAPELPCDFDDPGGAYNVMDVKECTAETRESISDFELPPSPDATYNCNHFLTDEDFSRPPPELPSQLQRTLLNETALGDSYPQSLLQTQLPVLNHLFVKQWDSGEPIALGSTHRFLEKYVAVILYKPSWRHM